jgi:hypothetical protein
MKVEIEVSEGLLKKLKALSILEPMDGGIDTIVATGLESWVDTQILAHVTQPPKESDYVAPRPTPRASKRRAPAPAPSDYDALDASGISSGLSDEADDFEDDARTSDPEAFIRPSGGLTEEAMDRDMRINDPAHEAKVDASSVKERRLTGADDFITPEQLFAEHSGLPTPPPVSEDPRAIRRRKKQTGKGKAFAFTGVEENTI